MLVLLAFLDEDLCWKDALEDKAHDRIHWHELCAGEMSLKTTKITRCTCWTQKISLHLCLFSLVFSVHVYLYATSGTFLVSNWCEIYSMYAYIHGYSDMAAGRSRVWDGKLNCLFLKNDCQNFQKRIVQWKHLKDVFKRSIRLVKFCCYDLQFLWLVENMDCISSSRILRDSLSTKITDLFFKQLHARDYLRHSWYVRSVFSR